MVCSWVSLGGRKIRASCDGDVGLDYARPKRKVNKYTKQEQPNSPSQELNNLPPASTTPLCPQAKPTIKVSMKQRLLIV